MSTRLLRSLVAVPAAVAAASVMTAATDAPRTWTVRPGGEVSMMTPAQAGRLTVTDTSTGTAIACSPSGNVAAAGGFTGGTGLPGRGIGSITNVNFNPCTGPRGATFFFKATSLPWRVNLLSFDAATRVVTGSITGVQFRVSVPHVCRAVVDGTSGTAANGVIRFTYADATAVFKTLSTGGNLHFFGVSRGCGALLRGGDPAAVSVTLVVSNPQTITSP